MKPSLTEDPLGYINARSALQENGCRLWTMSVRPDGRGNADDGDYAHRVAFCVYHGSIPDGHRVLQRCGNLLCVARGCLYSKGPKRPRRS